MPYYVEFESEFTRLVFTGNVEFSDCIAAIRTQRQRPTRLGLWDFSKIEGFQLTTLHIRALVSDSTSIIRPPGARVAVLTGSDQVFGMASMAEAYAEIEKLNQAVRVFRDGQAALAWLRGEPSAES